jgi:Tfp pilus assembly protein PilF
MRLKDRPFLFIIILPYFLYLYIYSPCLVNASDVISPYEESVVSITVNDRDGQEVGTGIGFIIEQNGIIATSCSVLSKWYQDVQNTMTVTTAGKDAFPIDDVLSYNCRKNVTIIKVDAKGLPSIKLARNHRLKKGEGVIIMFSDATGTHELHGIIMRVSKHFFETSVPVTPEMTGSPVLTKKGAVIGIVTEPVKKMKKLSRIIPAQEIESQLARYKKYAGRFQIVKSRSSRLQPPAQKIVSEKNTIQKAEKQNDLMNSYLLGREQEKLQLYADAIESFKKTIIMKPDYAEAYVNLGNVYYKVGMYTDATYSYREAIRILPGVPSLRNKLGTVLIILGEYKQAIDVFKEAIKIDSKNAEAHFNLGIAYFLDGDRLAATNVQKTLKELDGNRAQSLLELLD